MTYIVSLDGIIQANRAGNRPDPANGIPGAPAGFDDLADAIERAMQIDGAVVMQVVAEIHRPWPGPIDCEPEVVQVEYEWEQRWP